METAVVELLSVDEEGWQPVAGSASIGVGAWAVNGLFFSDFQHSATDRDDDDVAGSKRGGARCPRNAGFNALGQRVDGARRHVRPLGVTRNVDPYRPWEWARRQEEPVSRAIQDRLLAEIIVAPVLVHPVSLERHIRSLVWSIQKTNSHLWRQARDNRPECARVW